MANWEHMRRLSQEVEVWNTWREVNIEVRPDLSTANLREANLREADLSEADLQRADLSEANLHGANLSGANLIGANLQRANLIGANLIETNLIGANLSGANLIGADLLGADLRTSVLSEADLRAADLSEANLIRSNLSGANLSGANLNEITLGLTNIAEIDLRAVKGLTTIQHRARSYIELFSVQLPQDGSALHFLRGAGVPDEWIDDYRTKMMQPIQYHSCFISYTKADEMIAERLYADLQAKGVRCWFAPEDMKIGNKIRERIDEAIHLQDKSLLILSGNALKSSWVETEVETVLEKERRQDREILFPIRLDESVMQATKPWARHLRIQRHIGDFTKWENTKAYQKAFTRLLRDLKRSGT